MTLDLDTYLSRIPASGSSILDRHYGLCMALSYVPGEMQEEVALMVVDMAFAVRKAMFQEYPDRPLPGHPGYQRLAINYEREQRFDEALVACRNAKDQGWFGDWDKRIARIEAKQWKTLDNP